MKQAHTKTLLKLSFLAFLAIGFSAFRVAGDAVSEITNAFKSANTTEIVKYITTNIDISISGTDGTYDKVTADKALKDFFAQNPPQNFTLKHQGASKDGCKYAVGNLNAGGKNYRVHFVLKQAGADMHLQSIEIMKE